MIVLLPVKPPWNDIDTNPANTQRKKRVIITSKRRFDVTITCFLRFVFAKKRHKNTMMPDVASHSYQAKNIILEIIKTISQLLYVCDVSS